MVRKLAPLPGEYNVNIDPEIFNPVYLPHLQTIRNYEVYYGGGGSGKSNFVAHKLAIQLTNMPGRNLICLRLQSKDNKDSCFQEIRQALTKLKLLDLWIITERPEPRMVNRLNRNMIVFTGMDDVENVKSIKAENGNFTDMWLEEATEIQDARMVRILDRSLRDPFLKTRMLITFNPVFRGHWLYDFIFKELVGTDCSVLKTTVRDNKFASKEYVQKLERYRFTDPYMYQVYFLGEWGTTGKSVFNTSKIFARLLELEQEPRRLVNFAFSEGRDGKIDVNTGELYACPTGEIKVFVDPKPRYPYVLAFDTAGEGSDFYAAHVLDNTTGEQVAVFRSLRDNVECMRQIFALGKLYNWALMCPEVNFDSYPLRKLQEWGYPNIYRRRMPADRYHVGFDEKLGFKTQSDNRQQIISTLIEWANENIHLLHDEDTLNEMLTFTRQEKKLKGIFMGAENGAHDDLVMALAIVLQAREQQSCEVAAERVRIDGFYLPEEIDLLLRSGKIDYMEAAELKRRASSELGIFDRLKNTMGRARYAR